MILRPSYFSVTKKNSLDDPNSFMIWPMLLSRRNFSGGSLSPIILERWTRWVKRLGRKGVKFHPSTADSIDHQGVLTSQLLPLLGSIVALFRDRHHV